MRANLKSLSGMIQNFRFKGEEEMTDNEIIKALRCCKTPVGSGACNSCPLKDIRDNLRKEDAKSCTTIMIENALDLINRLKAEIEKKNVEIDILIRKKETLKDEISELRAEVESLQKANESFSCMGKLYSEIKSEARKEFAERLKKKTYPFPCAIGVENAVTIRAINDLLAEMESEGR